MSGRASASRPRRSGAGSRGTTLLPLTLTYAPPKCNAGPTGEGTSGQRIKKTESGARPRTPRTGGATPARLLLVPARPAGTVFLVGVVVLVVEVDQLVVEVVEIILVVFILVVFVVVEVFVLVLVLVFVVVV